MKRISTPLEPAPFNLCSDGYTALALAIYGNNSYLTPQEAAKTSEVCKTFKEIGETSDQALNYWKWHAFDLFDVTENVDYESTTKAWKNIFFSKADEILITLQNRILDEEIYECESDISIFEDYDNFKNFIKPIEKYSLKTNANKSLQFVIAEFYRRAWYILDKDDIDHEKNMATLYFKLSADQGDSGAQLKLGLIYYEQDYDGDLEQYRADGISDEEYFNDLKNAFEYFEKAACQGNVEALKQIILSYEFGKDFLINPELIFKSFKIRADEGGKEEDYSYGAAACYELGIGVKKNMDEAIKYYKIAAAKCCFNSLSKLELLCDIDHETIVNYKLFYFQLGYLKTFGIIHLTREGLEGLYNLAQFCEILGTEYNLQAAKIIYTKVIDSYKAIISSPLLHDQSINDDVTVITDITDTWYTSSKKEGLLNKAVWYEKERNLKEAAKYYKLATELLVKGK